MPYMPASLWTCSVSQVQPGFITCLWSLNCWSQTAYGISYSPCWRIFILFLLPSIFNLYYSDVWKFYSSGEINCPQVTNMVHNEQWHFWMFTYISHVYFKCYLLNVSFTLLLFLHLNIIGNNWHSIVYCQGLRLNMSIFVQVQLFSIRAAKASTRYSFLWQGLHLASFLREVCVNFFINV